MSLMKKILVLSSEKAGGGHQSLAQAIQKELSKSFQVEIYDQFLQTGSAGYFYIHHYLPFVYNFFYRLTDNKFGGWLVHQISFFFTLPSLRKIIWKDYDLIISVQAFLTSEIRRLTDKPLAIFIADPVSIHQAWICPQADLTLVATPEAAEICQKKGIPKNKVKVVGFPVRQEFYRRKYLLQKKPQRSRQFTVFLGGSGYGVRETKAILKYLLKAKSLPGGVACSPDPEKTIRNSFDPGSSEDFDPGSSFPDRKSSGSFLDGGLVKLIVVCGRNPRLKKSLIRKPNIKVYGFVKNIASLMTKSDLVIGKAGPNLLFESIALGIPFLATGYPPEQEKGNLELIKKHKIGFVEPDPKKAAQLILSLAKNPSRLAQLQPNLRRLASHHRLALSNIRHEINQVLR